MDGDTDVDAEAARLVEEALGRVAPDGDLTTVGMHDDLMDALGLDSIDVIAVTTVVHDLCGVTIPEGDYPELMTLGSFTAYLRRRLSATS